MIKLAIIKSGTALANGMVTTSVQYGIEIDGELHFYGSSKKHTAKLIKQIKEL